MSSKHAAEPQYLLAPTSNGWSEWAHPAVQTLELSCCDCGLVHDVQFRLKSGTFQFRVRRNEEATAEERKEPQKCEPKTYNDIGNNFA
jgi:hypothetical protein